MDTRIGSCKQQNYKFHTEKTHSEKTITGGVFLLNQSEISFIRPTTAESSPESVEVSNCLGGVKSGFRHKLVPVFGEEVTIWRLLNVFLAELIGTGMLLFLGCMSNVTGASYMQISLAFGLTAGTIIQTFGHVSAAHTNPACSLAAVVLGKITAPMCVLYFVAQCAGATLGYGLLLSITPDSLIQNRTCCTVASVEMSTIQAAGTEFLITAILIFLVCGCWDARNATKQDAAPIKFGLAITALSLAAGSFTGASMNPARSLGPALWHGNFEQHWIYWVSPLAAALIVPAFYRIVFNRDPQVSLHVTRKEIPLNPPTSELMNA